MPLPRSRRVQPPKARLTDSLHKARADENDKGAERPIDALPVSSSDEDESHAEGVSISVDSVEDSEDPEDSVDSVKDGFVEDISDSEDELAPGRGDISSAFPRSTQTLSTRTSTRTSSTRTTSSAGNAGGVAHRRGRERDNEGAASSRTTIDLTETQITFEKPRATRHTYGSQGSQGTYGAKRTAHASTLPSRTKMRRQERTEERPTFKSVSHLEKDPKLKAVSHLDEDEGLDERPRQRHDDGSRSAERVSGARIFREANERIAQRKRERAEAARLARATPEPRAVFQTYAFDAADSSFDMAALDADLARAADVGLMDDDATTTTCPLCQDRIDVVAAREVLDALDLDRTKSTTSTKSTKNTSLALLRLPFDDKVLFCSGHKQHAARTAWSERGYPAIDWARLPSRLETHMPHVEAVLAGHASASPFYAAFLAEDDEPVAMPGYYGERGQQVLTDAIIDALSTGLQRRTLADADVAARGTTRFVQGVLVPELAVRLIGEDMHVGEADARRILDESAALGAVAWSPVTWRTASADQQVTDQRVTDVTE